MKEIVAVLLGRADGMGLGEGPPDPDPPHAVPSTASATDATSVALRRHRRPPDPIIRSAYDPLVAIGRTRGAVPGRGHDDEVPPSRAQAALADEVSRAEPRG